MFAQKGTKNALGYVSGERLAERGRSQSPHPQTPITGAGHFEFAIYFGGQNQDLLPFYSRPTGAFSVKIWLFIHPNTHRLVPAFRLGAAVIV